MDALISPTSPDVAFPLGERQRGPVADVSGGRFHDRGQPGGDLRDQSAVWLCANGGRRRELPIGLQLLGKPLDEARILQIAHAYEQSTDWHKKRPPLAAKRPTSSVQHPTFNSEGMKVRALADRMNRPSVFRSSFGFSDSSFWSSRLCRCWHCLRGHSIKDYRVWYETGQLVLQGAEVYPDRWTKFPFMYPPPCALFLAPVAALGKTGLIIVLALVNAAAWYCCIIFSARLGTG